MPARKQQHPNMASDALKALEACEQYALTLAKALHERCGEEEETPEAKAAFEKFKTARQALARHEKIGDAEWVLVPREATRKALVSARSLILDAAEISTPHSIALQRIEEALAAFSAPAHPDKEFFAVVEAAYISLLQIPAATSRIRAIYLQPVLAGLRDAVAYLKQQDHETTQNEYEELARTAPIADPKYNFAWDTIAKYPAPIAARQSPEAPAKWTEDQKLSLASLINDELCSLADRGVSETREIAANLTAVIAKHAPQSPPGGPLMTKDRAVKHPTPWRIERALIGENVRFVFRDANGEIAGAEDDEDQANRILDAVNNYERPCTAPPVDFPMTNPKNQDYD